MATRTGRSEDAGMGSWRTRWGSPPRSSYTSETKPFFLTSEFLVLLAGVGALAASIAAFDHFDLGRGLMLITALAAAYIVSRGLSKAGTSRWSG